MDRIRADGDKKVPFRVGQKADGHVTKRKRRAGASGRVLQWRYDFFAETFSGRRGSSARTMVGIALFYFRTFSCFFASFIFRFFTSFLGDAAYGRGCISSFYGALHLRTSRANFKT